MRNRRPTVPTVPKIAMYKILDLISCLLKVQYELNVKLVYLFKPYQKVSYQPYEARMKPDLNSMNPLKLLVSFAIFSEVSDFHV